MDWNSTSLNNNGSHTGIHSDGTTKYHLAVAIILGIVLSILDLTTVLGNLLVCVTILSRRSLRNTTNYFILSLSCSDLLLGIIVLPFSTINTLLKVSCHLGLQSRVPCYLALWYLVTPSTYTARKILAKIMDKCLFMITVHCISPSI